MLRAGGRKVMNLRHDNDRPIILKWLWFSGGLLSGLATLSIARGSVPMKSHVTDDTALYQKLSDIRAQRVKELTFDPGVSELAAKESQARFKESLPAIHRISQRKYHFSGKPN